MRARSTSSRSKCLRGANVQLLMALQHASYMRSAYLSAQIIYIIIFTVCMKVKVSVKVTIIKQSTCTDVHEHHSSLWHIFSGEVLSPTDLHHSKCQIRSRWMSSIKGQGQCLRTRPGLVSWANLCCWTHFLMEGPYNSFCVYSGQGLMSCR